MHFDALTLACVADELRNTIARGRVQQVLLPDAHSIGLELYAHNHRRYLYISAQPGAGRIYLTQTKLRRGVEQETPLLLLLRKYVRDAILTEILLPEPTERLLFLQFEHAEHGCTQLVVEPMGRLSNVLLLKANGHDPAQELAGGTILECVHRVRPGERAQRVLLPGHVYQPPPRQERIAPWDDGSPGYYERLATLLQSPGLLWKAVAEQVAGASPTMGREVAWRATGAVDAPAQSATVLALAHALQELWSPVYRHDSPESVGWQPGVVEENGTSVAFSAYPIHFRDGFAATSSISEAVERYFLANPGKASGTQRTPPAEGVQDGYEQQRLRVGQQIVSARRRLERQLQALAADEPAPGEAETIRSQAEWLLALHTQLRPGQQVLEVDTGSEEGPLQIILDANKSPVEQAQQMFQRAAKMERAATVIPLRRARLLQDLEFVEQMEHDLALAQNQPEIAGIVEELRRARLLTETKQKESKQSAARKSLPGQRGHGGVLRFTTQDGYEILVGRNARQNETITFDLARPDDLWLHVRGAPGSHVIIRTGGRRPPADTLRLAAQIAAYYSKLRGEGAATVIFTPRRNVSRAPNGHTGQVLVSQEETITVRAELPKDRVRKVEE